MSQQSCSKSQVDRVRLASYLTIGVTGAMMATAHSEAAVVAIDLTNVGGNNITGLNGGVASGGDLSIANWLGAGTGTLDIYNNYTSYSYFGLDGDLNLTFAITGSPISGYAKPRNFASGVSIDSSSTWSSDSRRTAFRYVDYNGGTYNSPDFGANSFMGFRFGSAGNYNYGYLEVTWNSATSTFQLLSGAYETDVNTAILAGATPTPAAVPGAGLSAMALMALGGGAFRRRSRGRVA